MAKNNKHTASSGSKNSKVNQSSKALNTIGGGDTAASGKVATSGKAAVSSYSSGSNKKPTGKQGKNKLVLFLFPVLLIALIAFIAVLNSQGDKVNQQEAQALLSSESLEGQPMLGSADAKVTIVEFGDYKCPACKQWSEEVFPQLKAEYIDSNQAKFTFMQFPFISADSLVAANASEAVAAMYPNQFWQFHEGIYHAQQAESTQWATPEKLMEIAKQAIPDVDEGKLFEHFTNEAYNEQALKEKAIGDKAEVQGTPAVYVNGKPYLGHYLDYSALKAFIEQELKASK